jgi:hypothetical protein
MRKPLAGIAIPAAGQTPPNVLVVEQVAEPKSLNPNAGSA